ncbi:PilZ domain protein [Mariprofundus micogutta]|uniref:PilZ domain protein n=1 Tax=Mariprofundus micogutta TaxID=1921010 RepID=A0A1L8CM70_9PROT|nr:PilZ domain-containing protein [Mariprofundus micogutta]GAV20020.1 PilZ domain protein [Mariprofundus micogutta]
MVKAIDEHGRQDFRVDDIIPICDEKMTREAFEVNKSKVGIKSRQNSMLQNMVGKDIFAGDGQDVNPELSGALEALDAKLNYLIGVNMLNEASHSDMQDKAVNLSVTGASFISENDYQVGDVSKITLMLPSFPPSTLELLAVIKRVDASQDGRKRIGAQFYYRCDEEEDTVAKYVYRRHREMIRARGRNAELDSEVNS